MPTSAGPGNSIAAFHFLFGSHPAHTALIKPTGEIIAVNEAWNQFARENGIPAGYRSEGQNYLVQCERAIEVGDPDALEVLSGLLAIAQGRLPRFTWVYPCHSPTQKRWYRLWAAGHEVGDSAIIVAHRYLGSTPPAQRARSSRDTPGQPPDRFA